MSRPKPPIAANLRAELSRTGRTPEQVAVAVGARERNVRRWLSDNDVNPSWPYVERLAELFGRTPDWFFGQHGGNDSKRRR